MAERSLDLRLLECLVALVGERNVTRAAKRVAISQPRMSNALAKLRTIFNDPLLVRSGHRLVATERAMAVAELVRAALGNIETAMLEPSQFEPALSDKEFVLVLSDYTSLILLPALMASVDKEAPNVRISTKGIDPPLVSKWLDDGECHLAFGHFLTLGENLRASVLFHDDAICIARIGHPTIRADLPMQTYLAARHVVLAGQPAPVATLEHLTNAQLKEMGFERRVATRVATPMTLARIVAESDLIATLPKRLAEDYARMMPLQVIETPVPVRNFDISMVWHERFHRDPAHIWLRQQVRSIAP